MRYKAVAVRRAAAFSYYAEAMNTILAATHARSCTLQVMSASWPHVTVAAPCGISDSGSTY